MVSTFEILEDLYTIIFLLLVRNYLENPLINVLIFDKKLPSEFSFLVSLNNLGYFKSKSLITLDKMAIL